jgi:hypothetical protein
LPGIGAQHEGNPSLLAASFVTIAIILLARLPVASMSIELERPPILSGSRADSVCPRSRRERSTVS